MIVGQGRPKDGVLVLNTVHRDVPLTATTTAAVSQEIADLAGWLKLDPCASGPPLYRRFDPALRHFCCQSMITCV
ncbi:MAG TPA: hypothetical protein VMH35_26825 [Streptosporangiaceae bacterium]|nr:hypothetical protein [Streptosporangiaceae bacterium]